MNDTLKLPDPLVAHEVNLCGYEFIPIYGEDLRRSTFNSRVTDAEFRAAFNLWWSSWWQSPAASLPDEDNELCKLADLGRDLRAWRKVKAGAMSGFVLCSDGRWYHPFLAVIALDAWVKRKSASIKGRLGAKKSKEIRDAKGGTGTTPATTTGNGSGTTTANATASENSSPGTGSGGSKGSEVKLSPPLPPRGKSSSKPMLPSTPVSKTQQILDEQRVAAARAAPPPPGFMDTWKKPIDHFAAIGAKDSPTAPFNDHPAPQAPPRDEFDS